ncbi:recombinase family protein [Anaeromyxobacter paludicola]|uniref:Serine recombinase PinR n=1 Tax=Anaeromyxobacter paludicola TaxID=2918171 RepID=A0ABM7X8R1_9BACT|nr:recombinase family protein [Anaeromyxobacter paludicola]BDG08226.1 serine recombinase PinR [Anaeromyxobacter paludicola]
MRVCLYHRVSTLDQNPTLAREELQGAAARLGGEVVLEVEETGSGARNDRPGLQKLMDAARRGKLDAVVVWKLDRFGRSALDVLANIRDLDAAGVRFLAITQGIDIRPGGDAMSRLMLTMLAAVAEFERDLIRERTRLGMTKARAAGKHIGRPRAAGPSRAEVEELRQAGHSWREVAKALGCSTWAARQTCVTGSPTRPG